jgi:hypothetical protein
LQPIGRHRQKDVAVAQLSAYLVYQAEWRRF